MTYCLIHEAIVVLYGLKILPYRKVGRDRVVQGSEDGRADDAVLKESKDKKREANAQKWERSPGDFEGTRLGH